MKRIFIVGCGSLSAAGASSDQFQAALRGAKHCFSAREFNGEELPVAPLCEEAERQLATVRRSRPAFVDLDRSVMMAVAAARQAWQRASAYVGSGTLVHIGSSRGATALVEQNLQGFFRSGGVPVASSPMTTLGNISSWVAQDLALDGAAISHSVTCSTALHAVANALAWLRAGMVESALVGGAEAALTPFTLAQMRALRIYSTDLHAPFPCTPLLGRNSLALGEGASVLALVAAEEAPTTALAELLSVGLAMEEIGSSTGISEDGKALRLAMQRAIQHAPKGPPSALVLHAPGSTKGDAAELRAVESVFGAAIPPLYSTKWLHGHTFAASGGFSMEAAIEMLQRGRCLEIPYQHPYGRQEHVDISRVMVNATGFGGNAVSVLLGAV